ncbi:hypothetical protein FDG2_1821 [Candidatus Protofrankia californiensis]|uniref:DUF3800 domain-containing protein n=1 Tax=Candidatus Protofrankia californiensis TaxID=1839754 RepID=A0A1C3NWH0_9ACTN|nr:hypothetical protein FDG2_1821 [Candidatus Protofrankia californiensis]
MSIYGRRCEPYAPLVFLAYVDESYTQSWFVMAALLVDGPAAVTLTEDLGRVATSAAKAYGLAPGVELHGHEIFHGGGAWDGVPVRARVGVFDDVVEAVAKQNVRLIVRAMDVVGQRARYRIPEPPHTVVLQHVLERVDDCVTGLGDYALVIADEVDGQAKHRADLSTYREVGTTGYRRRKLTRIVDTVHFAPSHASHLVQAVDVITFLYRRVFTHQETDERSRKAKIAMWNRLVPRVHHELCWFPSVDRGQQCSWGRDVR